MIEFYWQSTRLLPAMLGTLLLAGGIILLHRAWLGGLRAGPLPGWALIAGGLITWTLSGDSLITGPAGLVWLMLIALAWIALQGQWPNPAARPGGAKNGASDSMATAPAATAPGSWKQALPRTLVAGPLAAFSALTVSLALAARLPGTETDRGVAGLFLLTILWAAALVWSCAAPKLSRPAAGLGLAALLATLSLLFI